MTLLDTGPRVALCDPRDGLNRTALRDLGRLAETALVLCSPVLTEACFLLPHPVQRQRLRRFIEEFSVVAYRPEDEHALWFEVFDWLVRYADHEPDLADAWLAVLCGRETPFRLWTYDREFRTTWRRPDGPTARGFRSWPDSRRGGRGHVMLVSAAPSAAGPTLVNWVLHGVKPEGDDLLKPVFVAAPDFGCKFTPVAYPLVPACP